ncbi:MAG TPA: ABC transporter permease subunit [Stellaceae bacterium]|nr:ABC transporter permease subunit [Stellaceae bacterium]
MTDLAQPLRAPPDQSDLAPPRSQLRDGFARLRRNHAAVAGLVIVPLIVLACIVGPYLLPFDPTAPDFDAISLPPLTPGHVLGTDELGRDLLTRILVAGRTSLLIGAVATLVAVIVGVAWGAVAGYFGGGVDQAMMRIVDILFGLPFLFFVIMLTVVLGRGVRAILIAICALLWLTVSVITRGQTLSLKHREFIEAARACGMRPLGIVWQHIIPNTLGPVIVYASLLVPNVILSESFLSYLGLGVQEPATSWGVLISEGANAMETAPWQLLCPGFFLVIVLLSMNFVADGLRDAFDPKDR